MRSVFIAAFVSCLIAYLWSLYQLYRITKGPHSMTFSNMPDEHSEPGYADPEWDRDDREPEVDFENNVSVQIEIELERDKHENPA